MNMKKAAIGLVLLGLVPTSLIGCGSSSSTDNPTLSTKAALGEQLYSDKNLSFDRTQSCATCHNPDSGFIDDRTNDASRDTGNGLLASAGSLGDNGTSIGDRNAPTAGYAAFSPLFHQGTRDRSNKIMTDLDIGAYAGFMGGQFWDGRETDLKGQAGGPPTNPDEMAMPDKASVVERIKENTDYIAGFEHVYGANIFDDADLAYAAMAESMGEFEKAAEFSPFDSKYDRTFLNFRDENYFEFPISSKALTGQVLFFSSNFTCAACHQLQPLRVKGELFTSFEYHNIGVPENTALRSFNGVTALDNGLLNNPAVTAESEKGKFKVPTLRNVAVTAPYMHNGIFNELETVIRFYQHAKDLTSEITAGVVNNPETGLPWGDAEIIDNIAHDILGKSKQNLNDAEVEALVCFIMSLTDARYESLLDPAKVAACGL
jgi:cytochrome c peroxidase